MDRNLQYDAAPSAGSTTGSFTIATFSPTWTVGDTYLMIANCAMRVDGVSADTSLYIDGVPFFGHDIAPRDSANDYYACPVMFAYEVASGTELLEFGTIASTATAYLREGHLSVFRLSDLDAWNDPTAGGSATTSTSFTNVTGSSVTIPITGDYLVLGCASCKKSETTANFDIQLSVNSTTPYAVQSMRANLTTKFIPYAMMRKLSLTAGDVLTLQHKVTTTGTVTTQSPSIVALNIANLPAVLVEEDTGDDSTTSGTYIDKSGMGTTFRTQAFPSLVLSCATYRRGAGSVDAQVQTLYDGTTICETRNESAAANIEHTHFAAYGVTPTQGDHTIKQQFLREVSGISNAILAESVVAVITSEDSGSLYIRGGSLLGGSYF